MSEAEKGTRLRKRMRRGYKGKRIIDLGCLCSLENLWSSRTACLCFLAGNDGYEATLLQDDAFRF